MGVVDSLNQYENNANDDPAVNSQQNASGDMNEEQHKSKHKKHKKDKKGKHKKSKKDKKRKRDKEGGELVKDEDASIIPNERKVEEEDIEEQIDTSSKKLIDRKRDQKRSDK
jgi:hypothetical protein